MLSNNFSLVKIHCLILVGRYILVERFSFAKPGDDGQPWRIHARSHEQFYVVMAGFFVQHDLDNYNVDEIGDFV